MSLPIAIFDIGPGAMILLGIIAVLLFGERLPEVGRTFGKKFVEFKKGLQTIEGELQSLSRSITSSAPPTPTSRSSSSPTGGSELADYAEATAPKFEPPPSRPGGESTGG